MDLTFYGKRHRTSPDPTLTTFPPGVPFIIGNELAERFSFYGMKAILVVFMTKHLLDATGADANMGDEEAKTVYHSFTAAAYFFPILGALLADMFWGKYKTILLISLLYCVGHGFLALMDLGPAFGIWDMQPFMYVGLICIAVGAGGIKPCVSAHVGDQFGPGNRHLITQVFNWFYFSINLGAAISTLLTPWLLANYGPWAAFGLPGVLMGIATFVFWLGRNSFIHVPPGGQAFLDEAMSPAGRRALLNLAPLFLIFIPAFWALFDQTGSSWVLQAEAMDRTIPLIGGELLPSQIQAANPLFILTLIPIFTYGIYPLMGRFFEPTPLRKIGIGLFTTVLAFAISTGIEVSIQAGDTPNILWQVLAYVVLTSAEIMVSIVALEFAYTQAPPKMKSLLMGVFYLGVSLGNLFTAGVNWIISVPAEIGPNGEVITEATTWLEGSDYFLFFTIVMAVVALIYVGFAQLYKGETYIQGDEGDEAEAREEALS
ncbi:MAG: POT family MFS transporter [Myxococcota bacterium]